MYRFARVRQFVLVLSLVSAAAAAPASAQDNPPAPAGLPLNLAALSTPVFPLALSAQAIPAAPDFTRPAAPFRQQRPAALVPLYVTFASLQALDAHSTTRALDRGAVEANPMMKGLAGNTAGMLAVKAAATTGVVYSAERIWKRNKTAAVLFMVAANSAMGWVVQHNYRAVR
jgi:hypothetical protein